MRYAFKTPWRDGTTHVLLEPLDFIARLAALIPRPGVNLTRYWASRACLRHFFENHTEIQQPDHEMSCRPYPRFRRSLTGGRILPAWRERAYFA